MSIVVLVVAAVLMFVCLCYAMAQAEKDLSYPVRPVPPRRVARPTVPVAYVDPGPIDPDAPWHDSEAVSALAAAEAPIRPLEVA